MSSQQYLSTVIKASEILICLCRGNNKIADITRKIKYNKTTVYRILNSFEKKGIVSKDPISHQYFPGPLLQNLSMDSTNVHDLLIHIAMDEMETLCHEVDETVSLVIPLQTQWFLLKATHSYHQFASPSRAGDTGPIYTGALGKVLLSQYKDVELNQVLSKMKLLGYTKTTKVDKLALLDELKEIRQKGYSISCSEYLEGGAAIAVPINYYSCPVALSIVGFEVSVLKKTDHIISSLLNRKKKIEKRLNDISPIVNSFPT